MKLITIKCKKWGRQIVGVNRNHIKITEEAHMKAVHPNKVMRNDDIRDIPIRFVEKTKKKSEFLINKIKKITKRGRPKKMKVKL